MLTSVDRMSISLTITPRAFSPMVVWWCLVPHNSVFSTNVNPSMPKLKMQFSEWSTIASTRLNSPRRCSGYDSKSLNKKFSEFCTRPVRMAGNSSLRVSLSLRIMVAKRLSISGSLASCGRFS